MTPTPNDPAAPWDGPFTALREALANASPGPWAYRPLEHDDWGMVRGPADEEGRRCVIVSFRSPYADEDELAAHRRSKTDPYAPNAIFATEARNVLPALLADMERSVAAERAKDARIAELEGGRIHVNALIDAIIDAQTAALEEAHKIFAENDEMISAQAARIAALEAALIRLRDCDWTIGRGDRMDPVRDIARAALAAATTQGER